MRCRNLTGSDCRRDRAKAKRSPLKYKEFAAPFAMNFLIPAFRRAVGPCEALGNECLGTAKVTRKVEQLWVVAKLLENVDRLQGLRVVSTEQGLNFGRFDE